MMKSSACTWSTSCAALESREEGNVKLVLPVHSIVWHRVSSAYLQRVGEFVGKDCWEIKCRRSRMILT
jgi:hypothetical protein